MLRGICKLLTVLAACPSIAMAADHYVRADATGAGNGSDWTDAYTTLPATMIRGDTYYLADGDYVGYDFDTAATGSTFIYIVKPSRPTMALTPGGILCTVTAVPHLRVK